MDIKNGLVIRTVKLEDCKSICKLNNVLGYNYDEDRTFNKLKLIINNSAHMLFVAEIDKKIVGYIHGCDYECTYSDSLKDILALVVDTDFQRLGVGKALINELEKWARETGASGIRLVSSMERENAHKFYIDCGYSLRKTKKLYKNT